MPQPKAPDPCHVPEAPSPEHEWVRLACRLMLKPGLAAQLRDLTRDDLDFDAVLTVATRERVAALLHHSLSKAGLLELLPPPVIDRLDLEYWHGVGHAVLASREGAEICRAISLAAVPPVVLKGLVLAETIYPTPGIRSLGDLDFLLEPEHVPAACQALGSMGYAPEVHAEGKREESKVVFERRDPQNTGLAAVTVEIHADVMRGRLDNRIARRLDVAELVARAEPWELLGAPARVLEATDRLLFLAAHISLQHGYFDLLWLMDLALVMQRQTETIDWDVFTRRARRFGLRGAAYHPLVCCQELFGVGPPQEVVDELRPSRVRRWLVASLGEARTCWDWNRLPGQVRAILRRALTLDSAGDIAAYFYEILRRGGIRAWRRTPRT